MKVSIDIEKVVFKQGGYLIYFSMNSLWRIFSSQAQNPCLNHRSKNIQKVCVSDFCKLDRFICGSEECQRNHQGHQTIDYKYFNELQRQTIREIEYRQQIQSFIRQYYDSFVKYLENMFNNEIQKLLDHVDRKFYTKQFTAVYNRHLAGKQYISLLPKLELNIGSNLSESIKKKISEKQKKISQEFKQFIYTSKILLEHEILPQTEKIQNSITPSKIDKIKSLLPFKCELSLKFQASKNKFLTQNLYQLGIRGPIILVAQSYKNRVFGGYSPKMFPKDQRYEQDPRCQSFLFSLDERIRLPLKEQYKKYAIRGGDNIWFGRCDLAISDECHKGNISWAEIGRAYKAPSVAIGRQSQWLAGAWYFRVLEYEIYEVDKDLQK